MIHSETVQTRRAFVTCDVCEKRMDRERKCIGCEKHVCDRCCTWWDSDPFTEDSYGDYPPKCCKACGEIVEKYAPKARKILNDAWDQAEAIQDEWKKECKS